MSKIVEIKITDEENRMLEHYFVRTSEWGIPGGMIWEGEEPVIAAQRELLERTGYMISLEALLKCEEDGDSIIFEGNESDVTKVAEPGERGGYSTQIRWR